MLSVLTGYLTCWASAHFKKEISFLVHFQEFQFYHNLHQRLISFILGDITKQKNEIR